MSAITQTLKRNSYAAAAGLVLLAAAVPALLFNTASAAQITARSIEMSSAAASASSVSYNIEFTAATTSNIKGVVVDFCEESPIIGSSTCTQPTGMTVGTSVGSVTGLNGSGSWTASTLQSGKTLLVENTNGGSVSASTAVAIPVSGFTNTSDVGTFYARIVTYADENVADDYVSATPGTHVDDGGVALSTTANVSVSATVQESLTFCVSAADPGNGCTGTSAPSITLGTGTPKVLDTTSVYTDTIYFQLSTNAGGNTSVMMKGASDDLTSGSNTIPGVGNSATAIVAGTAAFGMRMTAGSGGAGSATVSAVAPYNDGSNYGMDGTGSGVISTYGDEIANATGPVINWDKPMIFAATAGATTPAGLYTAEFSLIAVSSY